MDAKNRKIIEDMISASKEDPDTLDVQDQIIELRGAIALLLAKLAFVTECIIDFREKASGGHDLVSELELLIFELDEVNKHHFSEFWNNDEEDA